MDDFRAYAATVFNAYGTRVTYWTTFNEPNIFCFHGYGVNASHAPQMNSSVGPTSQLSDTAFPCMHCSRLLLFMSFVT